MDVDQPALCKKNTLKLFVVLYNAYQMNVDQSWPRNEYRNYHARTCLHWDIVPTGWTPPLPCLSWDTLNKQTSLTVISLKFY